MGGLTANKATLIIDKKRTDKNNFFMTIILKNEHLLIDYAYY